LLYDCKLVFTDQMAALTSDSKKHGTTGSDIDFALLIDGLEAEREQGITIDVAYRFFTTSRRSFIVADTPGHEQYTRNMATGASNSDVAVILVDARKGVLAQTKRHSYICSLLGIRHVVLAVNKIDLVDYSEEVFHKIVADYTAFAASFGFSVVQSVPISARYGDNVTIRSENTPWYDGPTLLGHLESIDLDIGASEQPFRFCVQWVNRPNLDFRGLSGTIASGRIRPGDGVLIAPSMRRSRVARIYTADGDLEEACTGQAVTLILADDVDVGRGDVLSAPETPVAVGSQFAAHVIWMGEHALLPGRSYLMRIGTRWVPASVSTIKHRIDVNTLEHTAARQLVMNEIALCNLATGSPVPFDAYKDNHQIGAFILVDRFSNETVGVGMIDFGLRRDQNVHLEELLVNKQSRAAIKHQKPAILWFTGLSGSGKSTIANLVEKKLHERGRHTYMLDGDNVRHGLTKDLGFTDAARVENIRRVGEVAKLFVDAGMIVICAFISPFEAERRMVRDLVERDEFIEVFVDTPLDECMRRDPKGLYAKAKAGTIKNFTGFDSPYEAPYAPELQLDTSSESADALAERVVARLRGSGRIE
jgi:bifunctional enzyme CysN/CysC